MKHVARVKSHPFPLLPVNNSRNPKSFFFFLKKQEQRERVGERERTVILFDILAAALAVAGPVGNGGAGVGIRAGVDGVVHDLDPENPVGEIAVVEGEGEIGIGGGAAARPLGLHRHDRVKQIRIRIRILHVCLFLLPTYAESNLRIKIRSKNKTRNGFRF